MCCDALLRENPPFAPSPGAAPVHVELEPVPASVAAARRFVREVLADADDDTREVALLLASELVTNAILHARTEVHLGVLLDGENLLLSVADRREDSPLLVPREKSGERPGGRGLALVDELSRAWGTERYTGGKTVWCVLPSVVSEAVNAG